MLSSTREAQASDPHRAGVQPLGLKGNRQKDTFEILMCVYWECLGATPGSTAWGMFLLCVHSKPSRTLLGAAILQEPVCGFSTK